MASSYEGGIMTDLDIIEIAAYKAHHLWLVYQLRMEELRRRIDGT